MFNTKTRTGLISRGVVSRALLCLAVSAGGAYAGPLYFDVTQDQAAGPPYPTGAVQWEVTHPPDPCVPPVPIAPVEIISLSLTNGLQAPPDDSMPLPMVLLGSDSGGRLEPGVEGLLDFLLAIPPPDDTMPAGSFFDVLIALGPLGRSTPVLVAPPDDQMPTPGSFDLTFETMTDEGTAGHTLHFQIGPGQPFTFANVVVGPPLSPEFHLTFNLDGGGLVDASTPLFAVTMSGDFTPVGAIPAVSDVGMVVLLLLTAVAGVIVIRNRSRVYRQ